MKQHQKRLPMANPSRGHFLNTEQKKSLKFLENIDSFEESEWIELYKLSENTFVEENDSLKQSAAGAGLTDND